MRLPRLIFINGPLYSGKTTLINSLTHADAGMFAFSSGYPALAAVDVLLHDYDEGSNWENEAWRKSVHPFVSTSRSYEQLVFDMLRFIETNCGPLFVGKKARAMYDKVRDEYETVIVSIAQQKTYSIFIEGLDLRDMALIRLHRKDTDWNDRGEYIIDSRVASFDLANDGKAEDLLPKFMEFFK